MSDAKQFAQAIFETVKSWIEPTIAAFVQRFEDVEARIKEIPAGAAGKDGAAGRDGIDGKDGTNGTNGAAGKDGAPGPDGKPGIDGKDGAAGPQGEPGPRGDAGPEGKAGEPGAAGRDGTDGKDGTNGIDGKDGAPGRAGSDGKSVTPEEMLPLLEAHFAKWALDFERRASDAHQRHLDRLPAPKDGIDAFQLEDLQVDHDGDGNVTLRFVRGNLKKEFALRLPRFKDKGVFREGVEYREGDGVTYGGSFWIAQKDATVGKTDSKPDAGNGDWRLAVKRGRDGKDGAPPAEPKSAGPVRLK